MKNTKTTFIVIIAIVALFGAGLTGYVIGAKNQNECENIVNNNEDGPENDNTIELTDEEQETFNTLSSYGKDIYAKETYKTLKKDEKDIYYATIKDLEVLGYDISIIDESCDKTIPVIYFDVDHKLTNNYELEPLQFVINCNNK